MSKPQRAFWSSKKTGEGNGWQKGTDGKWYQYKNWKKTGVVKQHLTPGSRVLKRVSKFVKNQQKLSQDLATRQKQSVTGKGTGNNPEFIRKKGGGLKPNPNYKKPQPRTWQQPHGEVNPSGPSSGKPETWPQGKTTTKGAGKNTGNGTGSSKVSKGQPSKTVKTNTVQNKGQVKTKSPMQIHGEKLDIRGRRYQDIPGYNESTGKIGNRKVGLPDTPFQVNLGEVSPDPNVNYRQALRPGGLDSITTLGELNQFANRSAAHGRGNVGRQVALKRIQLANKQGLEGSLAEQQAAYNQNVAMRQQKPQAVDGVNAQTQAPTQGDKTFQNASQLSISKPVVQAQTPIMGMGPLADPTMYGAMLRGNNFIQPTGTQGIGPIASGAGYGHNLAIMQAPTVPIPTPVIPPVATVAPTLTIGGM